MRKTNLPSSVISSPVKLDLQTESALKTVRCQVVQPLRRRSSNDESLSLGRHNHGNHALNIYASCQCHPWKVISHPDRYMTMYLSKREIVFSSAIICVR